MIETFDVGEEARTVAQPTTIAILGGGYAGLFAAQRAAPDADERQHLPGSVTPAESSGAVAPYPALPGAIGHNPKQAPRIQPHRGTPKPETAT